MGRESLTIGWVRSPRIERETLFIGIGMGCSGPRDNDLEQYWFAWLRKARVVSFVIIRNSTLVVKTIIANDFLINYDLSYR